MRAKLLRVCLARGKALPCYVHGGEGLITVFLGNL